jgi:hypothetical protein
MERKPQPIKVIPGLEVREQPATAVPLAEAQPKTSWIVGALYVKRKTVGELEVTMVAVLGDETKEQTEKRRG